MDYLLKTNTEFDMDTALEAAGLLVEQDIGEGELVLLPIVGVTVDRIGSIPPQYGIDGNIEKPENSQYHANLRVNFELTEEQISALPIVDPPPAIPYRVFL